MAAGTLAGDIYGEAPRIDVNFDSLKINVAEPGRLWVDYDPDTDSMLIYTDGKPSRSVSVYLDNNIYVLVDPVNRHVLGFQVELWERNFLPQHADLQLIWPQIKQTIACDDGWSEQLKVYLMFVVMLFQQFFNNVGRQPPTSWPALA